MIPTDKPVTDPPLSMSGPYFQILIPLLLAHVLQSAGSMIDGVWIGHLRGVQGIAAVSAFFPVFFVILSAIIGMSASTSVLVGQAWGAKDVVRMRQIAGTAVLVALGLGLVVSVVGATGAPALMKALGTPADVLDEATAYAQTLLVAMPLTFTLWTCMSLSRGAGDPQSPMWALLAATCVGAIATPALVAGWGPIPRLEVQGAAVSGLLAQVVAFVVLLRRWRRAGHPLISGVSISEYSFVPWIARKIFSIGIPASLQMMSMALAEVVLLGLVNQHGSNVTAAYGAATQLLSWVQFPAMCLGIAASILTSHVIGAGRLHRVRAVLFTGLFVNAIVTTVFVAAAHMLAPVALQLFVRDPAVLHTAVSFMRTVAWSVVLLGWSNVIAGTLRAGGVVWAPTLLGMAAILCIELPAALFLEPRWGLSGLWWAYPIGFGAMVVLHGVYCVSHWSLGSQKKFAPV